MRFWKSRKGSGGRNQMREPWQTRGAGGAGADLTGAGL